jgi:UDP-N-acetylmuramoylalanine--D-glutamate ligase
MIMNNKSDNIKIQFTSNEKMLKIRKELIRESLDQNVKEEHRLEHVAEINGVEYINDSKSSDIDSTWFALEEMTKPIVWIVGGVDKGNDYSMVSDIVKEKVRAIVCLGKDNSRVFDNFHHTVPMMIVDASSAKEAVAFSKIAAKPGDVVLLSPACPSYDLFEDYKDRGNQFKKSVLAWQEFEENKQA